MHRKLLLLSIVFLIAGLGWLYGCGNDNLTPPQSINNFLPEQKGKIVILLLGMEGCNKTMIATDVLSEMSQNCPNDVVLARMDVPLPEGTIKPITTWNYKYFYFVDNDRTVANRLDFFYYPTLYVLDRDGEIRYSGGCDAEKLKTMINEIRAETPGSKKKLYTPPMLAVGTPAIGFTAKTFHGNTINLTKFPTKGATLLFFTSATCPFSRKATSKLADLEKEFKDKDVTIIIVEKGSTDTAATLYSQLTLNGPVVLDENGYISQQYGVEPVPFYFVIDKDGKVASRGPYTETSARQALQTTLGLENGGIDTEQPKGAG